MEDLLLWLLTFIAGVAVGAFGYAIFNRASVTKNRQRELVVARMRIVADVREKQAQELLREILQTAVAFNAEMNKSLGRLAEVLDKFLIHGRDDRDTGRKQNSEETRRQRALNYTTSTEASSVSSRTESRAPPI